MTEDAQTSEALDFSKEYEAVRSAAGWAAISHRALEAAKDMVSRAKAEETLAKRRFAAAVEKEMLTPPPHFRITPPGELLMYIWNYPHGATPNMVWIKSQTPRGGFAMIQYAAENDLKLEHIDRWRDDWEQSLPKGLVLTSLLPDTEEQEGRDVRGAPLFCKNDDGSYVLFTVHHKEGKPLQVRDFVNWDPQQLGPTAPYLPSPHVLKVHRYKNWHHLQEGIYAFLHDGTFAKGAVELTLSYAERCTYFPRVGD